MAFTGLILLALATVPWNPWAGVVAVLGSAHDHLAESRLLQVSRPPPRPWIRAGGPCHCTSSITPAAVYRSFLLSFSGIS